MVRVDFFPTGHERSFSLRRSRRRRAAQRRAPRADASGGKRPARLPPFLHQLPQHRSRRRTARLSARQVPGRNDDRAAAPVLGPRHRRGIVRGDGELQQAAGAHKGAVRRAVGLRRSLGALRPAIRPQGQGGGRQAEAAAPAAPTTLPAPDKRPTQAAPAGTDDKPEATAAADGEAKPEDAASKIVKLDSFRKK